MANLEEMPQLVLEKITSFLSHKELLKLEQVSKKLKVAVDAHFCVTDHLFLGHLPKVKNKAGKLVIDECFDGLVKLVTRCGIRLRTIQISVVGQFRDNPIWSYETYLKHLFASPALAEKCPNIENIITSPKMEFYELFSSTFYIFKQQKYVFNENKMQIYTNRVKLSTGESCKLRSISATFDEQQELRFERILFLYSNLEQIVLCHNHKIFLKYLPQFIENGLKDVIITVDLDFKMAEKFVQIGEKLRTLLFNFILRRNDDIVSLNKLQLQKNVNLQISILNDDGLALLNENVCNSISSCDLYVCNQDYRVMSRFKNVQVFNSRNSEQLKSIAEGWFPKLTTVHDWNQSITCSTDITNVCDKKTILPQLLTNKGNQLTVITIEYVCCCSFVETWKALKHCVAAKCIIFNKVVVDSSSFLTYDDVTAIFYLPNLQRFKCVIKRGDENDKCDQLRELMERAANESAHFTFDCKLDVLPCSGIQLLVFTLDNVHF